MKTIKRRFGRWDMDLPYLSKIVADVTTTCPYEPCLGNLGFHDLLVAERTHFANQTVIFERPRGVVCLRSRLPKGWDKVPAQETCRQCGRMGSISQDLFDQLHEEARKEYGQHP